MHHSVSSLKSHVLLNFYYFPQPFSVILHLTPGNYLYIVHTFKHFLRFQSTDLLFLWTLSVTLVSFLGFLQHLIQLLTVENFTATGRVHVGTEVFRGPVVVAADHTSVVLRKEQECWQASLLAEGSTGKEDSWLEKIGGSRVPASLPFSAHRKLWYEPALTLLRNEFMNSLLLFQDAS